jgi:hypothetical protein
MKYIWVNAVLLSFCMSISTSSSSKQMQCKINTSEKQKTNKNTELNIAKLKHM